MPRPLPVEAPVTMAVRPLRLAEMADMMRKRMARERQVTNRGGLFEQVGTVSCLCGAPARTQKKDQGRPVLRNRRLRRPCGAFGDAQVLRLLCPSNRHDKQNEHGCHRPTGCSFRHRDPLSWTLGSWS